MKVSVCIITYNHEKYIAQAVESVLMQKTDFDFEIIIGEDDSKDATREIVKKYKEQYPDRIRLFLNDRKNVIYINGRPTGRWNFMNNIRNAGGDYIAVLDGDDYWISPDKLQTQVNFLESHPECAMCFHDVRIILEDESQLVGIATPRGKKKTYTLKHLLKGNFMHTCSVMFRSRLFNEFPEWFYQVPIADWPLHVLNAQHGDIGYIPGVMGTYRVHSGGVWTSKERIQQLKNTIKIYKFVSVSLHPRYNGLVKWRIIVCHLQMMEKKAGLFLKSLGLNGIINLYRRLFYPLCPPE
jgi:glycosyltransferase involved in cell wall biosynthesis